MTSIIFFVLQFYLVPRFYFLDFNLVELQFLYKMLVFFNIKISKKKSQYFTPRIIFLILRKSEIAIFTFRLQC